MKNKDEYFTTQSIKKVIALAKKYGMKPICCEECGKGFFLMANGGNIICTASTSVNGVKPRIKECYEHETQDLAIKFISYNSQIEFN